MSVQSQRGFWREAFALQGSITPRVLPHVITFGLIACAGVIPLALIAGHVRGIPFPWRILDCSFGVFGAIPLLLCRHYLVRLEKHAGA